MKRAWLIAKKDLKIFFSTPLGYIILALTVFVMSLFFDRIVEHLQKYAQSGPMMRGQQITLNFAMEKFYYNMMVILMFMIPGLTMRAFCAEKRENTLELLVTAPLKLWELVLGKFLGVATMYLGLLTALSVYFFCAIIFGKDVDINLLVTTQLGLFLIGMAFASIGIFTSSLTSNQFVAYLVSFTIILGLFLVGSWSAGATGWWAPFIEKVNLITRFTDFTKGVVTTGNVVFFLSFFFFWMFLTFRVIESQNWRS